MDFQLCTGAIYILIKLIGYIMRDQDVEVDILWGDGYMGGKLAWAIMVMMFKGGYTVKETSKVLETTKWGI